MLRLGENVQAEHALEERRVAEVDDAVGFAGEFEADRDLPTFGVSVRCVKVGRFDLLLSESVDYRPRRRRP